MSWWIEAAEEWKREKRWHGPIILDPRWEFVWYFQCSRIELHELLSAYHIYQVQEGNMCKKDWFSTIMIKIDKGLFSKIVSRQMDINIVNSNQCNSIFKINQTINRERRKHKKGKENNSIRSCSMFSILYSLLYFLLRVSTEDVCTDR